MRINGFEQIKGFYSWVFDNQDKQIRPQHISLYIFMVNQNNRNNWIEWFKMPFDLSMTGACISSKKTYYSCLSDLKEWGLISYEKGVNNWKAPLVRLEVLKDTSTVPQSEPQQHPNSGINSTPIVESTVPLSVPQSSNNIKPVTSNLKLYNLKQVEVLLFFGFTESPKNINHQRLIKAFFYAKTESGEIDGFIEEFDNYRKYIEEAKKQAYKFRLDNYLGDQKEGFTNGKWNSDNWVDKLKAENSKLTGAPISEQKQKESVFARQKREAMEEMERRRNESPNK